MQCLIHANQVAEFPLDNRAVQLRHVPHLHQLAPVHLLQKYLADFSGLLLRQKLPCLCRIGEAHQKACFKGHQRKPFQCADGIRHIPEEIIIEAIQFIKVDIRSRAIAEQLHLVLQALLLHDGNGNLSGADMLHNRRIRRNIFLHACLNLGKQICIRHLLWAAQLAIKIAPQGMFDFHACRCPQHIAHRLHQQQGNPSFINAHALLIPKIQKGNILIGADGANQFAQGISLLCHQNFTENLALKFLCQLPEGHALGNLHFLSHYIYFSCFHLSSLLTLSSRRSARPPRSRQPRYSNRFPLPPPAIFPAEQAQSAPRSRNASHPQRQCPARPPSALHDI